MQTATSEKLETLAGQYGHSIEGLLEAWGHDSVVPGICMNPGCEFTAEYEPDQREGWCGACATATVASALVLAGVI